MNWKEKIADWLTGGVLTSLDDDAARWHEIAMSQKEALRDIAEMKTPSANATVKRMAARAEEVLE